LKPITWREFQKNIAKFTEHQLKEMLEHEMKKWKRIAFAERIHQRLCAMRMSRERIEILRELSK